MPNDTRDDIRGFLLEAASDLPVLAPSPERTIRRARRRMIGTVSVGALAIGLVVGGLLNLANPFSRSMPAKEPHMRGGTYVVSIDTGAATRYEGLPRGAFWFDASRDGSTVAIQANAHGTSQIFVMDPDGTDLHQVTHDPREASQPALSPDGSKLAYKGFGAGDTRNVFVIDLTTRAVVRVTHERRDVSQMEWSPDGSRILYSISIPGVGVGPTLNRASSSLLKIADAEAGTVERIAGTHRSPADFGTWSPDGSQIAFMTGREWPNESYGFDPAEIWIMNEDGSDPHEVFALPGRGISLNWSPTGSEIAYSAPDGDTFSSYTVDVDTHEVRRSAPGYVPVWLNDHELIVHIDR